MFITRLGQDFLNRFIKRPLRLKCYEDTSPSGYDQIISEIKALNMLTTREEAPLLNYLQATSYPLGLLINFGAPNDLDWKRMAATESRRRHNYRPLHRISED